MYGLNEMLLKEQKYLEDIIYKVSKCTDDTNPPSGKLCISVDGFLKTNQS